MKKTTKEFMMTENYCDDCDEVLNAPVDVDEFYSFKVGRIRCQCGCIVKPCNECQDENGQHYDCSECPWEKAKILDAMTTEEYVKWEKKNEPKFFKMMLKGDCGDILQEAARKIK